VGGKARRKGREVGWGVRGWVRGGGGHKKEDEGKGGGGVRVWE